MPVDDSLMSPIMLLIGLPAVAIAGLFWWRDRVGDVGSTGAHEQQAHADARAAEVHRVARAFGLKWQRGGFLAGPVNGVEVKLHVDAGRMTLEVSVRGPLGTIEVRRLAPGVRGRIPTGDPAFDEEVAVSGRPLDVVLALTATTRRRLHALLQWSDAHVDAGRLVAPIPPGTPHPVERIRSIVALAADADGPADRLRDAVLHDPLPPVRVRATAMLPEVPDRGAARRIAHDALSDHIDEARAGALRFLVETAGPEEFPLLAARALRDPSPAARRVAVAAIGERRDVSLLDGVLRECGTTDEALACEVARALARFDDPRAESGLLGLLTHASKEAVGLAVRALAETGTRASVTPLLAVTGPWRDAAHDAAKQIEARAGGDGGGRLSLAAAEEEAGALSLATDGGGLALAGDDEGSGKPAAPERTR